MNERLSISVAPGEGDAVTVSVGGELDHATAPLLGEAIASAAADRPAELVLDLADLVYVDSSGLGTILAARAALAEQTALRVVGARGNVARIFERSGLGTLLNGAAG